MSKSSVSPKRLTTIPQEIRKALKLKRRQTKMKNNQKGEKTVVQVEKEIDPYEALKGKRNSPETTYERVEHLADKIILNLKEE